MLSMRFFNTAGPVNPAKHYCLPPLERFDLARILLLIEQEKYFVLHAPRQTGKTSCLLTLMDYLNARGTHDALYVNVESAQGARENVFDGIRAILAEMGESARIYLQEDELGELWPDLLKKMGEFAALGAVLTRWCERSQKPLILLIDEIDSLVGDTLISVLRQLRSGYARRPDHFPQSIILCGVRDVRDYRIHSDREKTVIAGGSAFNVKAESLRLGNFSQEEVQSLFFQHSQDSGQEFETSALKRVWKLTGGQPWLVNALGYELCFRNRAKPDPTHPVTAPMVTEAKEAIILRRETHLDQLTDKLREARVRRIIEPVISGFYASDPFEPDDVEYVRDLGLISVALNGEVRIANPIYQEVIPRELSWDFQVRLDQRTEWYVRKDGSLDTDALLKAFQDFFRQHAEHWIQRFHYQEAGPQLLLQAFLQRIVNGGGRVEREYGMGRKRVDLFLTWPYSKGVQKIIAELKVRRSQALETLILEGISQTWDYMDRCGSDQGHLIVFDRNPKRSWEQKIFRQIRTYKQKKISVWGV